jgi:hypothetical protein
MLGGVRVVSVVLRGGALLALLLGLGFWTAILPTGGLVLLHMFLGLVVVGSVWYLGLAQAQRSNGSLGLTLATFVIGLLLAIIGLTQVKIEAAIHNTIGIQILHVALALVVIGLGEMCTGRIRRAVAAPAQVAGSAR